MGFEEIGLTILNAAPFAIDLWDQDLVPIDCNKQALDLFGVDSKDEYRERIFDLMPEYQPCGLKSRQKAFAYLREAQKTGRVRFEFIIKTNTGELVPIEVTLVRVSHGESYMIVAYVTDLREVKAAAEDTNTADERSAVLLRSLPIACVLYNESYETVACNQAAVDLFAKKPGKPFVYHDAEDGDIYCAGECGDCIHNRSPDCIARIYLRKNWNDTIAGYKENPQHVRNVIKTVCDGALKEGVRTFYTNKVALYGEAIYCEITVLPVTFRGSEGFALYIRDLRDSKARELAEQENRAKTKFLARMSHEIRTPMNAVLGITEIELKKGTHPPETEDSFLRIHRSSSLLLSIINDILDLSKVEAGRVEIVITQYDVMSLIVDTVQLNLMHLGDKQINFQLGIDENLPMYMHGDEMRIRQILNNLLSNAFKYTAEGIIKFKLGVENSGGGNDCILVIEVEDTGQGMTPDEVSCLFQIEFTRYNTERNRTIEGSGLGMIIASHLVGLMDGEITVRSEKGVGSVFTVRIPQRAHGAEVLGKKAAANLENLDEIQKSLKKLSHFEQDLMLYGRVLVVDDVESNLFVAKGLLAPYKLHVETVESGSKAIELVKNGNVYDIIFMDHMMPEPDGIETTKLLHEMGYKKPIIALTANIAMGQAELFKTNGFAGFISKPIDSNYLDSFLKRYIRDLQPEEVLLAAAEAAAADQERNGTDTLKISGALNDSFLRDAKKAATAITNVVAGTDFDDKNMKLFTINTHAIKSALANVGESELSRLAYELEEAGRARDMETINAKTSVFLRRLDAVIKTRSADDGTEDAAHEDLEFLKAQLMIVAKACDDYDKKKAKEALAGFSGKGLSCQSKKVIDEITVSLLHSDFETAAETARTYASHT